jgi:hypothetical protein
MTGAPARTSCVWVITTVTKPRRNQALGEV